MQHGEPTLTVLCLSFDILSVQLGKGALRFVLRLTTQSESTVSGNNKTSAVIFAPYSALANKVSELILTCAQGGLLLPSSLPSHRSAAPASANGAIHPARGTGLQQQIKSAQCH